MRGFPDAAGPSCPDVLVRARGPKIPLPTANMDVGWGTDARAGNDSCWGGRRQSESEGTKSVRLVLVVGKRLWWF